jgi:hypothetical protein
MPATYSGIEVAASRASTRVLDGPPPLWRGALDRSTRAVLRLLKIVCEAARIACDIYEAARIAA